MEVRVAHLYPTLLNIYADRGNILAFSKRCLWREIDIRIDGFGLGEEPDWMEYDFFYLSGGQDREQNLVALDLGRKAAGLTAAVEDDAVLLSICGGYQLLGDYYRLPGGDVIEGIGLFGAHTIADGKRCIGNVLIEAEIGGMQMKIVGFENHGGKTYLDEGQKPLGRVLNGFGNNAADKTEGIIYKNAFGTYLHGPLLPKNAVFTDYLISRALRHRYGKDIVIGQLEHNMEDAARLAAINRTCG